MLQIDEGDCRWHPEAVCAALDSELKFSGSGQFIVSFAVTIAATCLTTFKMNENIRTTERRKPVGYPGHCRAFAQAAA